MLSKEWIDGTKFWLNLEILFLSASIAGLGQKSNTLLQAPAQENLPYLNNLKKKNEDLQNCHNTISNGDQKNQNKGPNGDPVLSEMGIQRGP